MSATYPDLPLTTFPESVDQFTAWLNILASDGNLIKQYQDAIKIGNQELANQIILQIPAYNQKIITAKDLNKLEEAIRAIERFYKTDIVPYVTEKQKQWQGIVDQFKYAEPFNIRQSYVKNNYVSYGIGTANFLFIATDDPPVGTIPTDSSHWRQLTIRGATGQPGDGVSFSGKWDGSRDYFANVCVEYGGALWLSLRPNNGKVPMEGSEDWALVARVSPTIYPVTKDKPVTQKDGELWFEILE